MTDRRVFNDADANDPLRNEADSENLYLDGSYGDVAFPALAVAGDGFLLSDGTAALTFTSTSVGNGFLLSDGVGAVAFGFSAAGIGSIEGEAPVVTNTNYGSWRLAPYVPEDPPLVGAGGLAFGFASTGHGFVEDETAFLLLVA